MGIINSLPPQQLPFSRKTKEWRKKHLDWAEGKTYFNHSPIRNSINHKRINYDLINGKLHMSDMQLIINPDNTSAGYIPDAIQHYPIINSKLNVLRGEESKRIFDYRVIVTNPNAISEIENNKKEQMFGQIQQLIQQEAESEEAFNAELEKINQYFTYEWQDLKEIKANALLNHYVKEYNMPLMFNQGFMDACTVSEEIYQCSIIGGEPTIEKINPLKIKVFKSGMSSKIEDADVIILENYLSPGKIIDNYYDVLTKADVKYLENIESRSHSSEDSANYNEADGFINSSMVDTTGGDYYFDPMSLFGGGDAAGTNAIHDGSGNIRELRMYWKSRRKIKKVKTYDQVTGEEVYTLYPETFQPDKNMGEEVYSFWINEAWEATKLGAEIYVNMRPRVVQYNRISNPSRCHFGIIGSVYNFNDARPFSLVDMMKPYNYLYNAIHDRLNKLIASNWGKIIKMDFAQIPKGWDSEKWLYYAKVNHIAVTDSFKEGNIGAATGKLAGGLNNNSSGVIDAEVGNSIQQHINLLEFIKMEMAEVAGISKQREGQISNRETVGGVERATLQSSHITEWLFFTHEDVKRRSLECFLETAKVALKGGSKKFQYILSDMSLRIMEIDGDDFADADYGLLVDNSNGTQQLNDKLDMLAQAALQNQTLSFSAIMKLYNTTSMAEKQRMVETNEQEMKEQAQQAQQGELQSKQEAEQMKMQMEQQKLQLQDTMNQRDNETRLLIAQMNQFAGEETSEDVEYSPEAREKLLEQIRQFDEKIRIDKEKLELDKVKHRDDVKLRNKQIDKQAQRPTTPKK